MHERRTIVGIVTLLAATSFAAGCADVVGPELRDAEAPAAVEVAAEVTRITGTGTLGTGSPTPGSELQDFDFDVASDLTGRLFFRDWSAVRESGTAGSITVDPADEGTGITGFRTGSAACSDPGTGVEFDGIGRLDTGDLYGFIVRACDQGPADSGADFFEIVLPDRPYARSGSLSSGDIVKSGGDPPTGVEVDITGAGTVGTGSPAPGSALQEFDFTAASDRTGELFYRDWAVARGDGTVATVTVAEADAETGITAVRDGSASCEDPANGAEFDGTGRLDTGELVGFTVRVCDAGPADSGADFFEISVPSHRYTKGGLLSSGDIVKTTTEPEPEPTTGSLTVTAATTGAELDPDGYTVTIDGGTGEPIAIDGSVTFSDVAEGDHSVTLSGVAENCAVGGSNPRTVTVPAGGTTSTTFDVSCAEPEPTTGDLTVRTSTSGASLDLDGFAVTVDGGAARAIGTNGSITFSELPAGDHIVALSGVAPNCSVGGSNPRTVTVPAGGTASTAFAVACEAVATRLVFTVQPSDAAPYATIEPAVRVTAVDAYGNRVAGYTGTVTIAIGRNGGLLLRGSLSGTKTVAAVNGVATFSDLSIDQLGSGYTLRATASGLSSAESDDFDIVLLDLDIGLGLF